MSASSDGKVWGSRAAFIGRGAAAPRDSGDEFPVLARTAPIDRRTLLKFLGLSAAIPLAACAPPAEEIVPYVRMPEGLVAGKPMAFATAFTLGGIATGVVAESHEGRPTKIEGNPDHPASGGGTDAFQQAMILSLYDPGRASLVKEGARISSFDRFEQALLGEQQKWAEKGGEGLRILMGASSSPTLARLLGALRSAYPKMRVHRYEPIGRDNQRAGAERAFGQRLDVFYRPDEAQTIVALDADFLGPGPEQARLARAFSKVRKVRKGGAAMARLYVAEPSMSATGATADIRLGLRRGRVDHVVRALAASLGLDVAAPALSVKEVRFVRDVVHDLNRAGPQGLLIVGEAQPPHVHQIAHAINAKLGSLGTAVTMARPVEIDATPAGEAIAELTRDMRAGAVEQLVILGANPVYEAPADLDFAAAMKKVRFSVQLSLYEDETSDRVTWHVPQLHALEEWSDTRSADGTVSIVQPLVTPLFEGYSPLTILAAIGGRFGVGAHEAVLANWSADFGAPTAPRLGEEAAESGLARTPEFDAFWRKALSLGLVEDTAAKPVAVGPASLAGLPAPAANVEDFELVFLPDPSVWDGRFANNAWLQETPKPVTKLVWGNAAMLSPSDQRRAGLKDGDEILIKTKTGSLAIPQMAVPGQVPGTIGLHLGYGRRAGSIGRGVGTDVMPLRTLAAPWAVLAEAVTPTGVHVELASTQGSHDMHGRDIVRTVPLDDLSKKPEHAPDFDGAPPTLFSDFPAGRYEWAMVIDHTLCISCNACVVACQSENNVPVVGPEEVRRGRDMHWLRVDSYFSGEEDAPEVVSQPVPCMHCEKAPCEPMCPVEASVHDSEGLNVQVYNRCIGTRDCQSNCPYKVRRFNFFGYGDGQEYGDLGEPIVHAARNPDVSVRARGVMEKCTYCLQRISGARRNAEKEHRTIGEAELKTACQQACPAEAIAFGNLSDKASTVNALRREPHHYALLEELGTRPRTTYLARVVNRPAGEEGGA